MNSNNSERNISTLGSQILSVYHQGLNNEKRGRTNNKLFNIKMLGGGVIPIPHFTRAYSLGREDFYKGDKLSALASHQLEDRVFKLVKGDNDFLCFNTSRQLENAKINKLLFGLL